MKLSAQHFKDLEHAFYLLENPGLAIKIADLIGKPIDKMMDKLPKKTLDFILKISNKALGKATNVALFTLKDIPQKKASNKSHKVGVVATGAIGGFFGGATLAFELPISTIVMLRSIADIARSEGESLDCPDTKMACLEVFAMGSTKNSEDDAAESAYYILRAMLAKSVKDGAEFLATKTLAEKGAPAIVQLIKKIAERFAINISEKAAVQSIPIIGAVGGATMNIMFMDHFQDMAKGHFIIRRLEKIYGLDVVKSEYERLRKKDIKLKKAA